MTESRPLRAGRLPEVANAPADRGAVALDGVDVVDVDDVRGPRRRLGDLRRPGRGLTRPWMVFFGAHRSPGLTKPRDAGARQPGRARVRPLAERQDVDPVVASLQRMGVLERQVDDAVARTHVVPERVLALPLDGDARSREDVEDLLLSALEVERRRPHAGIDLDALHADGPRRLPRQAVPGAGDVAAFAAPGAHVVPVRDHTTIMSREVGSGAVPASAARRPSTASSPASPPSVRDHCSASPSSARSSVSNSPRPAPARSRASIRANRSSTASASSTQAR